MIQVTGETIKSAISLRIVECCKTVFNDLTPTIYKEKIVQDAENPCYFIWTMDVTQRAIGKDKFTQLYQMNIRYNCDDDCVNVYEELNSKAIALLEYLSTIYVPLYETSNNKIVNLPVYSKDMEYKITEGVLQLFANYTITVNINKPTAPLMGQLEINNN